MFCARLMTKTVIFFNDFYLFGKDAEIQSENPLEEIFLRLRKIQKKIEKLINGFPRFLRF